MYRHGYVPTYCLLPLLRTRFRGKAAEQRQQCPWNSACCFFTSISRGTQQQMAETKHREKQLKQCCKGTEWLGLLNLGSRGLKGGMGLICLVCFNSTKSSPPTITGGTCKTGKRLGSNGKKKVLLYAVWRNTYWPREHRGSVRGLNKMCVPCYWGVSACAQASVLTLLVSGR